VKWYRLFGIRLKAFLKDGFSVIIIILAVVMALALGYQKLHEHENDLTAIMVDMDRGNYGQKLTSELRKEENLKIYESGRKSAMKDLAGDEAEVVVMLHEDFTEKISAGEYSDVLDIYFAPSSAYGSTVAEPVISNVMIMWMDEALISRMSDFLEKEGIAFSEEDEKDFRREMAEIWKHGSTAKTKQIILDTDETEKQASGWFAFSAAWYLVLALFYILISGSWMTELSKRSIRIRSAREGMGTAGMFGSMGLASAAMVFGGFIVVTVISGGTFEMFLHTAPMMLIYLVGTLGISLCACTLSGSLMALMLTAPFLTFLFGTMSGLIVPLPQWAYGLELISAVVPGRWMQTALSGDPEYIKALVFAAIWCLLGLFICIIRKKPADGSE
jgi:hypothetical protein